MCWVWIFVYGIAKVLKLKIPTIHFSQFGCSIILILQFITEILESDSKYGNAVEEITTPNKTVAITLMFKSTTKQCKTYIKRLWVWNHFKTIYQGIFYCLKWLKKNVTSPAHYPKSAGTSTLALTR